MRGFYLFVSLLSRISGEEERGARTDRKEKKRKGEEKQETGQGWVSSCRYDVDGEEYRRKRILIVAP